MTRPMDHLAEQINLYQRGRLNRRQLLERGAAIGLSAAGLAALGAINPVAGQERFARPSIRAAAQEGAPLRVALATAQKTGDLGPVDAMVAGMERGAKELNYEATVVELVQGEYTEAVRALADSGADLIIAAFPPMIDTIVEIAPQYPDQHFSLIIGETPEEIPNVMSFWELGLEACYLVGALAGLHTQSGVMGAVIATRNPEQDRFIAGYQQGIKATNKDAKFLFNVVAGENPFEDPATAKRLAMVLNEQGADVVMGSGGQSIQGVHEAAKESAGAFVSTGMDTDQCLARPASTLASVRIYEGNMVYRAMKATREGDWTPGNFLLGIADGGEDICTFDDSSPDGHLDPQTGHEIGPEIPQEIREMIWSMRKQVVDGGVTVENRVEE
ncbi:MAG: BMP family ABC transporter substrate-binding protein [Thermomicrobiales bacterium]|nr:BMP family ABC transporter substrate-binding protein [Thermomicrobiales bacterium]